MQRILQVINTMTNPKLYVNIENDVVLIYDNEKWCSINIVGFIFKKYKIQSYVFVMPIINTKSIVIHKMPINKPQKLKIRN